MGRRSMQAATGTTGCTACINRTYARYSLSCRHAIHARYYW